MARVRTPEREAGAPGRRNLASDCAWVITSMLLGMAAATLGRISMFSGVKEQGRLVWQAGTGERDKHGRRER